MTEAPDVLVVGCGAAGLSIARQLALRGAKVTAVDRAEPGTQASPRAAGQSVSAQVDPAIGTLMRRSMDLIARFADETGVPFPFHRVGSVKYACSDWAAGVIEREVARAAAEGTRVEVVGLDEAARLAPHTDPSAGAVAAWHSPDDLYFRPPDMVAAFERAAREAGVEIRVGPDVAAAVGDEHGVTGVATSGDERIAAGAVVVAAGAWTGPLLERSGVARLPLTFVRHQCCIRSGVPGIHPELPSVRVIDESVYARPEGERLLFGTYEPRPLELAAAAIPDRSEQVPLDPAPLEQALRRVRRLFRGSAGSVVDELRGAVVTMTPDRGYLIDAAPELPGLFFFTGCNVLGLSTAPAIGEDVARWVATGDRPETLAGFGLARFAGLEPEQARRRGLAQYERTYRDDETVDRVRP